MKTKSTKRSPNPAARALRDGEFRQRIVKAKKSGYTRKEKHKKREDQKDGLPFFVDTNEVAQQVQRSRK